MQRTDLLESTLVSVLQSRPHDCEIIVVHRGVYDDPYRLQGEVQFINMDARQGLADSINLALGRATGAAFHTLACGVEVQEGWCESPLEWLADENIGSVTPVLLRSSEAGEATEQVDSLGVGVTLWQDRFDLAHGDRFEPRRLRRQRPLGPSIKAGFYRRDVLESIGGFDASMIPQLIDLDVAMLLHRKGHRNRLDLDSILYAGETDAQPATDFVLSKSTQQLIKRHRGASGTAGQAISSCFGLISATTGVMTRSRSIKSWMGRCAGVWSAPPARLSMLPGEIEALGIRPSIRIDQATHRIDEPPRQSERGSAQRRRAA